MFGKLVLKKASSAVNSVRSLSKNSGIARFSSAVQAAVEPEHEEVGIFLL